ncbi:hypothetical protein [Streptomyces sp. NPDC037389]|uniref:hypothetical protein n=1 Tax=Streptomyces sp. NPDC037389 TaxID=3155369 RepID=UPI0033D3890E
MERASGAGEPRLDLEGRFGPARRAGTPDDMLVGGVKPWAVDPGAASRLWELSRELTGVSAF